MRYKVIIELDFDGNIDDDRDETYEYKDYSYQDMCDQFWKEVAESASEGDGEIWERTFLNEATGDATWEKVQ